MPVMVTGHSGAQVVNWRDGLLRTAARLASAVGLPAARTDVMEFTGARCLVVTRFDCYRTADGTWRRIHQEDAVQAFARSPRYGGDVVWPEPAGAPGTVGSGRARSAHDGS